MAGEYYEVHYILPNEYDVQIAHTYRGKKMRSYSSAEKQVEVIKKQLPEAEMFEICLYDEEGCRLD